MNRHPRPTGFRPGAKVVCINDQFPPAARPYFQSLPRAARVYTIRTLVVLPEHHTRRLTWSCTLAECRPLPIANGKECGFNLKRFRLVEDAFAQTSTRRRKVKSKGQLPIVGVDGDSASAASGIGRPGQPPFGPHIASPFGFPRHHSL